MGRGHEKTFLQREHTDDGQTWEDAHQLSSGICKSKQLWDTTSHQSEWLLSKSQEITSVGENVHRRWDCKLMQPLWKTAWRFPKKLKIDISYNPAIPLLGIYPKKTKTLIQKDTCTTMFTVALFTTAKIWKQPRCPLIDEWRKMWYVCVYLCVWYVMCVCV